MSFINDVKQKLRRDHRLNSAEWPAYLFDLYRVFPRVAFILATWASWDVVMWYMHLTSAERTGETTAFVSILIGAYVKLMDYYMQRGVDWSKRMEINGGEANVS
jgi:hypothetical protein